MVLPVAITEYFALAILRLCVILTLSVDICDAEGVMPLGLYNAEAD